MVDQFGTKPNYFLPIQKAAELDEEKVEEKVALFQENVLHNLSLSEGWKILREYIEQEVKNLDNYNRQAIENGMPFDEIGRNTVLIQLCKEELNKVINKVEDAKEAVESRPTEEK